jgi:hypothetical protein
LGKGGQNLVPQAAAEVVTVGVAGVLGIADRAALQGLGQLKACVSKQRAYQPQALDMAHWPWRAQPSEAAATTQACQNGFSNIVSVVAGGNDGRCALAVSLQAGSSQLGLTGRSGLDPAKLHKGQPQRLCNARNKGCLCFVLERARAVINVTDTQLMLSAPMQPAEQGHGHGVSAA